MVSRNPLYQIDHLQQHYGARTVLDVPKLEIFGDELFAIVGPSGAGKSTLLRLLHFLEPSTSGTINYQGERIDPPVPVSLRRQFGMVFQRPELLDATVWDNVAYPLRLRGMNPDGRIETALQQVGLLSLSAAHAYTLSGGEVQRVALARVLVIQPKVLFLDEPTANLDPYHVELMESIVKQLRQQGSTVILVTHNVFQARRLADRVALLLNGHLVEVSNVDKFFTDPDDERVQHFVRGQMIY